jgi:glycosyltransferase involved in cell wall biosynthesis
MILPAADMATTPLISIITPSLNRARMIEAAIESVLAQDYPRVEHIVVDGGSTDGTLDRLKRHPHLRLVSGPDAGMYDALNKGLAVANGEVIGFLNSDDLYAEGIFGDVAGHFVRSNILATVGRALIFTRDNDGATRTVGSLSPTSASMIELATLGNPVFNAWFFRRSVFERIGNFNVAYRIVGDRDFILRFVLASLPYEIIQRDAYRYLQHGDSLTFELTDQKYDQIVQEHIAMTAHFLDQESLPGPAREFILRLRTRETIKMSVIAARTSPQKAYRLFLQGITYDPRWPLRFIQKAFALSKKRLRPRR